MSKLNFDEKIKIFDETLRLVREEHPETKVYKTTLLEIKNERIPLRSIPVLAEDKKFRGIIAAKIRNLD